jgi:transposase
VPDTETIQVRSDNSDGKCNNQSGGRSRSVSGEKVEEIRTVFHRSPNKTMRRASKELTVHTA